MILFFCDPLAYGASSASTSQWQRENAGARKGSTSTRGWLQAQLGPRIASSNAAPSQCKDLSGVVPKSMQRARCPNKHAAVRIAPTEKPFKAGSFPVRDAPPAKFHRKRGAIGPTIAAEKQHTTNGPHKMPLGNPLGD